MAAGEQHYPGVPAHIEQLRALLARVARDHSPAALASSFSIEDMVLIDAILRNNIEISIFALDTGRLHDETLALVEAIRAKYGYAVEIYRPQADAVRNYVHAHGRDGFYKSIELRKHCCEIRKVEPLRRALAGKRAWLTGMRREQSPGRAVLDIRAFDDGNGLEKFNPLADWSEGQVWSYLRTYQVPYNTLYDNGYRSIGCAPCTRPVVAGEDARAGRWWWESADTKECGLHVGADGKLKRSKETVE